MKTFHHLFIISLLVSGCAGSQRSPDFRPEDYGEILSHWDLLPTETRIFETSFSYVSERIALYRFVPRDAKEWVIISHGYLDHIGTNSFLIRFLLTRGYAVAAFDLPGHGLSKGPRADIGDFEEYGDAWAKVLAHTAGWGRRVAVGHSTSCAGLLTAYQRETTSLPEKTILIAPLVRIIFWELSKFAYTAFGSFATEIPAKDDAASRDRSWIETWKNDPYTGKVVPANWFRALQEWEPKTLEWRTMDGSTMHIFQGTADGVVDWAYNVPFLTEKFPGIHVHLFPDGWHGLQYDYQPARSAFYEELDSVLARERNTALAFTP